VIEPVYNRIMSFQSSLLHTFASVTCQLMPALHKRCTTVVVLVHQKHEGATTRQHPSLGCHRLYSPLPSPPPSLLFQEYLLDNLRLMFASFFNLLSPPYILLLLLLAVHVIARNVTISNDTPRYDITGNILPIRLPPPPPPHVESV
jgi:hypothetical protein